MPLYRSLQIQEGKFDPEQQETSKSDDKEMLFEHNLKFLDPLRDFNIEHLRKQRVN